MCAKETTAYTTVQSQFELLNFSFFFFLTLRAIERAATQVPNRATEKYVLIFDFGHQTRFDHRCSVIALEVRRRAFATKQEYIK